MERDIQAVHDAFDAGYACNSGDAIDAVRYEFLRQKVNEGLIVVGIRREVGDPRLFNVQPGALAAED